MYSEAEPRRHLLPTTHGKGTRIVKSVAFTLLASLSFAYLALCAYGISKTGSTAGLADIGNAAILSIAIGALAALIKK